MLSLGGARGVEKAELNGNVDSDNNHGGSSRTYVLHRTGCSQEDDQLLRQGCKRSGSPGRQGWGNAMGTRRLDKDSSSALDRGDGSNDFHRLDLRSPTSTRAAGEGSASADAARPSLRPRRRTIGSMPARSPTACAATSCRSATWPPPPFATDAEPCAIATCWCARW